MPPPKSFSASRKGATHANQRAQSAQGHCARGEEGQTTAHIRIDLGNGSIITSSITNEAVDELGLKTGDKVTAIIKASNVMVGK